MLFVAAIVIAITNTVLRNFRLCGAKYENKWLIKIGVVITINAVIKTTEILVTRLSIVSFATTRLEL